MTAQTTSSVSRDIPTLLALLRRQVAMFEHLQRLSHEQARIVQESPADALLALLATRQRFTDALTQLQAEIEPYRSDWPVVRAAFAGQDGAEVDRLVDRSATLLEQILGQDDRDRESLQALHARIGSELGKINHVSRARNAYTSAPSASDNRFTNRQG